VPAGTQAWVALLSIVAAMGVWTSSARALGYVQEKVSFAGLGDAQSVAVDSANNVYTGDVSTPQVLES
jgi:pyruvoyl-dependent arginine decarboxylase (PvlArgDC)